ncbi:MAG: hypothetical protein AAFR36_16890 [Bacteroidota bacterium]
MKRYPTKIRVVLREHPVLISSIVVVSIFLLRLSILGGFDPSCFILVSEEFVVEEELMHDLIVFKGGYDGQFYYRYAVNPFSKDKWYVVDGIRENKGQHGIKVDAPKYRRGRLTYPLAAWTLALGQAPLIPYTLILVNLLGFILLIRIVKKLVLHFQASWHYYYFPLLIVGLYFSVARGLPDLLVCTLLAWSYLCFLKEQRFWFVIASTLLLLCKESSGIFLVPAYLILGLEGLTKTALLRQVREKAILFLPWIILLAWKLTLQSLYPQTKQGFTESFLKHFDLPFKGIYESLSREFFIANVLFMTWGLMLIILCVKELIQRGRTDFKNWMYWGVWINLLLILCYAFPIYVDMWSFMRVLAASHMLCFFFLLERQVRLPQWFVGYSTLIVMAVIIGVVFFP